MSLALAHKRRVLAEGAVAVESAAIAAALPYSADNALKSPANARKNLALLEAALDQDLLRLSDLKVTSAKQELKRSELLPKYLPYVQRYRESGLKLPNRVLVTVMIWLFDTVQFDAGHELAQFAMDQGQEMPERFKRDIPTFVADAVIEWAYAQYSAGRSPEPYLSDLLPRVDGEWALPEQIPSKYHKLIGMRAMADEEWETALKHFERSTELYAKAGNGERIKQCRKALAKQRNATTTATS
ncbi:Phage small terminase subunit [Pseudomonas cichorii]|uniref:Phage small terminase subunit n=1 Tax=Pseudomonas cichorii TaxID=36746 RepID=A0A3M4M674_PSECI|nr:phage terminase small subunit [Pseudomonas cichorii]RMQ48774.1 Phage small terminase subunit [Pseudomonas cichorii]